MNGTPDRNRAKKGPARRGGRRVVADEGAVTGRARMCVGCTKVVPIGRVRRATSGLMGEETTDPVVRIVLGPNGELAVDSGQHGDGGAGFRGAYVHASVACLKAAAQRGLSRAAKATAMLDGVPVTLGALASAVCEAYRRRATGLLLAAKRARALAIGSDAATLACRAGDGHLLLVAADAAQAADMTEVRRAVTDGRAVAWASKAALGEIVRGGPTEGGVGVVAITDARIAAAVRETLSIVASLDAATRSTGGGSSSDSGSAEQESVSNPDPAGETRHGVARGTSTDARASIVHGWAATLRGSDDPGGMASAFRAVEWSA